MAEAGGLGKGFGFLGQGLWQKPRVMAEPGARAGAGSWALVDAGGRGLGLNRGRGKGPEAGGLSQGKKPRPGKGPVAESGGRGLWDVFGCRGPDIRDLKCFENIEYLYSFKFYIYLNF